MKLASGTGHSSVFSPSAHSPGLNLHFFLGNLLQNDNFAVHYPGTSGPRVWKAVEEISRCKCNALKTSARLSARRESFRGYEPRKWRRRWICFPRLDRLFLLNGFTAKAQGLSQRSQSGLAKQNRRKPRPGKPRYSCILPLSSISLFRDPLVRAS